MKVVAFNGSPRKDGNTVCEMIIPGSCYWNMAWLPKRTGR